MVVMSKLLPSSTLFLFLSSIVRRNSVKDDQAFVSKPLSSFALFLFLILLSLTSCKNKGDGTPNVARYKDKFLTQGQLNKLLPPGLSKEDALQMQGYLKEQWGRDQAIEDEILKLNPGIAEKFEEKIADYRHTLMIQAFDNYVIENKLDTNVPVDSIMAYYSAEKNNFLATEDRFSYFYVAVPEEGSGEVENMMNSNSAAEIKKLVEWSKQKAILFRLDSSYVDANTIEQDRKGYLGTLENVEKGQLIRWSGVIQGQRRKYFFKMLNSVEKGEPLPFELVRGEIRQILLTGRKQRLIEAEHKRVFTESVSQSILQTDL